MEKNGRIFQQGPRDQARFLDNMGKKTGAQYGRGESIWTGQLAGDGYGKVADLACINQASTYDANLTERISGR